MRVLFLESSPIWINGLARGFYDSGHHVMISGQLSQKNLAQMVEEFKPDLMISVGWGKENTKQKQKWIKEQVDISKVPLIYWSIEDPAFTEGWSLPLITTLQPDFVFTISPEMVNYYNKLGVKSAFMDFGYHPDINFPTVLNSQCECEIAVVANAYPDILEGYPEHYRHISMNTLIRPLLQQNIRVDFWGRNWDQIQQYIGIEIPKEFIHGFIPYTEANLVYNSSKIIIGLQNYTSQVTQRTYEILGSGGFLLTNDTPGVRQLFKPGQDLVCSSSGEETLQLVRYYLEHPQERSRIRENGRTKVIPYTYKNRSKEMIEILIDNDILQDMLHTYQEKGTFHFYESCLQDKFELYIVHPGDTLWGISREFNVTINELKELNALESDQIEIDQVLKIRKISDLKATNILENKLPGSDQARKWVGPIHDTANKYGVPFEILYSIMIIESAGNPNAVSRTRGIGLMQLTPETANWLGVNPLDPIQSIDGAARYLRLIFEEFGDWKLVVAAYNAGPRVVKKHGGILPREETQNYVHKVLSYSQAISGDKY